MSRNSLLNGLSKRERKIEIERKKEKRLHFSQTKCVKLVSVNLCEGERDRERERVREGERERVREREKETNKIVRVFNFQKKFETKTSRTDFPSRNSSGKKLNFCSRSQNRERENHDV